MRSSLASVAVNAIESMKNGIRIVKFSGNADCCCEIMVKYSFSLHSPMITKISFNILFLRTRFYRDGKLSTK